MIFKDKTVLITGGTGSLGNKLIDRILSGSDLGNVRKIIIFSRDENKQYEMKTKFVKKEGTHEIFYGNYNEILDFRIGDIRDKKSLISPISESDIIINAAALKHVPICEYFPSEAILTNIIGSRNIVEVIKENKLSKIICDISTDKACKPVNVYGMTKALQERIMLEANYRTDSRFICVRYGNVMASRGSIIPLFQNKILAKKRITLTTKNMTRFFMSLDKAVDTIFEAIQYAEKGETFIPIVPSSNIFDLGSVMVEGRDCPKDFEYIGIRPGEKEHEILISEEEIERTYRRGGYYVIGSIIPEINNYKSAGGAALEKEYSSRYDTLSRCELKKLLTKEGHLDF